MAELSSSEAFAVAMFSSASSATLCSVFFSQR